MRVLVTGASGYIGRQAVADLLETGADVHAVTRSGTPQFAPAARIIWYATDLLTPGTPEALVARVKPDVVLHLAWNAVPGVYWTAPDNAGWQRVTTELFSAFVRGGGRRFVGAGTCAEYEWGSDVPCHERTTPTRPATLYGTCKLAAAESVEQLSRSSGVSAAWGRIFFLFGGSEHPSRLAPSVARSLLHGEPALCTHGEQVRDFLHVSDVAAAFVALLRTDVNGPVNIASGQTHRVKDVALGIGARLGRPDLIRLGARETSEPPVLTADVSRLFDEVGWRPAITFEQALDETVAYWRDHA